MSDFDPQNPPSHGQSITYNCSTEGYNRFEDDFEQSSLTLDCLAENKFSLTTWPKCVASKFNKSNDNNTNLTWIFLATQCPNPNNFNTDIIIADVSDQIEVNYTHTIG